MKVRAIVNPRAGFGARRALEAMGAAATPWKGLDIAVTTHPGHARTLAEEAVGRGFELVLAVGGDGTANEAAQGLLGSAVALGLVPHGSGNGLARALRIPLRRPERALGILQDAEVRPMDVGLVNGRVFLNVAGVGFDAAIGAAFHAHGRRGGRRGLLTYFRYGVPLAISYRSGRYAVSTDSGRFEGRALLVTFANGPQFGGAAYIAPGAALDDGLLDIVVVEDAASPEILWNAPRLFRGTLPSYRRYHRYASTQAVLEAESKTILYHRDGEPEECPGPITVSVAPGALRVLVPRDLLRRPDAPFAIAARL